MKKFLYIMPAVLICMLYCLLLAIAGGISGIQPVAIVYILSPILAGIILRKGKWWGCLFGISMAALLAFIGRTRLAVIAAIVLAVYYAAMGLLCAMSKNES